MGHKAQAPVYSQDAAITEQNRLNQAVANQYYADVNSPLGGYSINVDPKTGQMTVNKQLSGVSNYALTTQGNILGRYMANPQEAQNSYYSQQMQYVNPTFANQINDLQDSLTNRGIRLGSKAWNSAMDNVYNAQDKANTAMINNALFNGQQYQRNLLSQAGLAGSQVIDPTLIEGQQGAGLYSTYEPKFENEKAKYQTAATSSNKWGQALGIGGGIIGGVIGGIFGGPAGAKLGAEAGGNAGSGWGGILDNR